MTEWIFAGLGLVGLVAFIRQVLIRQVGWPKLRAGCSAFLVLPVLVCVWTVVVVITEWGALNHGGGLALLVVPIALAGALLIGAVGIGLSMLLDMWPEDDL